VSDLEYKMAEVQYVDLNAISKNVGIRGYHSRGGFNIEFRTKENRKYKRTYIGILQQILAHKYYTNIMADEPSNIGFYISKHEILKDKNHYQYFSLNRKENKDIIFYMDIYSFVKKKYSVLFIVGYMVIYLIIFSRIIKMNMLNQFVKRHKIIVFGNITFIVLYMLL
jgi:hypothetical protein